MQYADAYGTNIGGYQSFASKKVLQIFIIMEGLYYYYR